MRAVYVLTSVLATAVSVTALPGWGKQITKREECEEPPTSQCTAWIDGDNHDCEYCCVNYVPAGCHTHDDDVGCTNGAGSGLVYHCSVDLRRLAA